MGLTYLWDTNTVIYYLQQQFPPTAEKFIDGTIILSQPAISAITEIELLCWKTATPKDIQILNAFINDAWVFELDKPIKLKTAELRKQFSIKLPDAIIAATALENNSTLLTRNVNDFKQVNGLAVINPHDY